MEIKLTIVVAILFIHWVADFLCQTDWMAQNKSKDNVALLAHVGIYSFIWFIPMFFMCPGHRFAASEFVAITMICHYITDYFTSRLNSKLWEEKKVHWFFVSVGFDQFLHYLQLLLTYWYSTKQ